MIHGQYTFDDRGESRGPFSAVEIQHLVHEGVIRSDQTITADSGDEILAGDVSIDTPVPYGGSPPPTLPSPKKASWDPRVIGWLGLVFSPFWSGIMAVVNARRLGLKLPIWRPVFIVFAALLIDIVLDLLGLSLFLVTIGLFVGANWLIWKTALRPQLDAYSQKTTVQKKTGRWLVPLIVGSPLAIVVFCTMVIAPLVPGVPKYVSENEKGNLLYEQGEYENSLGHFNRAIELNPQYAVAHNNRGLSFLSLGRFDEAVEGFDNAIQISPELIVAYHNRALTLNEQGDYKTALLDFDHVLRETPNDVLMLNGRGAAGIGKSRACDG